MSQENLEVVRRYFEAFDRGDVDGWKSLLAPEVEFVPLASDLMGGPRRGAEAVARTIIEFTGSFAFASYSLSPEAFYDAGDQVVAVLHRSARSARSSATMEDRFAQLFSLRDGCIVRMRGFRHVHEALEALGLSE
jgi:ketosteroid isomerase-like protein